jgi:hypothetical protein
MNTRLAVRKQRDGLAGFEIPFIARLIETGRDDDDDPISAPILDWQATQTAAPADAQRWTPSMRLLRRVLMTTLADHGHDAFPFIDGPQVRACDIELVRAEFYRQSPAEGDEEKKKRARQKAFHRSINDSIARSVVAVREVDGVQLIWLTKPETAAS